MDNDDKINSMVPAAANVHKEVALLLENELTELQWTTSVNLSA